MDGIGGGNIATPIVGGLVEAGHDRAARIVVVEPGEAQRQPSWPSASGSWPWPRPMPSLGGCRPSSSGSSSRRCSARPPRPCAARTSARPLTIERDGRHPQRRPCRRARHRARRPGHAEHGGADRPGHHRTLCPGRPFRPRPIATGWTPCSRPTGGRVWVDDEAALDAVTALSGSGPGLRLPRRRGDARGRPGHMGLVDDGHDASAGLCRRSPAPPRSPRIRPKAARRAAPQRHLARRHHPRRRWRFSRRAASSQAFVDAILAAQGRARELGDAFDGRARVSGWPRPGRFLVDAFP